MTPDTKQTTIFGEPTDRNIIIQTRVGILEPWISAVNRLVDECKLHFRDDGVYCLMVDPANVGMLEQTLHADGLQAYQLNGTEDDIAGINVERFYKFLQDLKYSNQVTLSFEQRTLYIRVRSEYDNQDTEVIRETEMQTIDPDSVRAEPDIPNLETGRWVGEVSVRAFNDVISHCDQVSDYQAIREQDGHLVFSAEADTDKESADFGPIVEPYSNEPEPGARSLYSLDYVKDMAGGLDDSKAKTVEVVWGDQYPMDLRFERQDGGEPVVSGRYMLAPRVK